MRRKQKISARKSEQGIIITLVAIFMLGVIGAMAALSIDVVTIYTARSEAQLAAEARHLAAARVIANSGATSDSTGAMTHSRGGVARSPLDQCAIKAVGGRTFESRARRLTAAQEITVLFGGANPPANPNVKVSIQKDRSANIFRAHLGKDQLRVAASGTAEAYNASGRN